MIPSIVEAALRALLVALAVWGGLRVLRVCNVLAQKAAWGLVLAAALAMPLLLPLAVRSSWLPAATLPLPALWRQNVANESKPALDLMPSTSAPAQAASRLSGGRTVNRTQDTAAVRNRIPDAAMESAPATLPSAGSSAARSTIETAPPIERQRSRTPAALLPAPAEIAGLVYVAVSAVLLLRLLYGLACALTLWWDARPVEIGDQAAAGLRLRASRAVCSPVTIGSGVVLPEGFELWDQEKLRIVLAHERSHIRQGDFYLQLVAGLYAAIFWFSPLGWWLKRKLSDLGEAISDRAGLEEAASRSSYAQLLLEFAALPRPTLIGVAMARTSSLSHRIERLLNDSIFRSAFAGSRRRALLAILLVPVALFAATMLIRVQAAEAALPVPPVQATAPAQPEAPVAAQAPVIGQSNPNQAQDAVAPQAPAMPPPASPDRVPAAAPAPPAPAGVPSADVAPEPPALPDQDESDSITVGKGQSLTITNSRGNRVVTAHGRGSSSGSGYGYSYSSDGNSWALITGADQHVTFNGDYNRDTKAAIDKARSMAHGKFIWFSHDGRNYLIDDPSIVGGVEAMYKPMEELGRQQEELGREQEKLGREQERLGQLQEQTGVPTPDVSREIAELNAALAKLQAKKGGTMTQDDLADLQGKIGNIQGRLGDIEGKIGDAQGKLGDQQGKLGEQQGRLGEKQGQLGEQQGRIAEEADRKMRGIIDQTLRDGKARPVE